MIGVTDPTPAPPRKGRVQEGSGFRLPLQMEFRRHSPPFKGRGRGGVCNILSMRKILTPPQPLPYKGLLFIHIF